MKNIFIAKLGENGRWLPLSQHLKDTAETMRYLCSAYVTESMVNASSLDFDTFVQLAIFCAAVHDIGKASAAFQGKITMREPFYRTVLLEEGFSLVDGEEIKCSPHALAGATILNRFFDVEESVCDIVAAHHGIPRADGKEGKFSYQLKRYASNYYGNEGEVRYKQEWEEIFAWAKSISGITQFPEVTVYGQMLLTGLVIMADWIASNEEFFPLFSAGIVEISDGRAELAMRRFDLPEVWRPSYAVMDDELFAERFGEGFRPNYLQREVIAVAEGVGTSGIMIIEAPMGVGKTEAALAVAELLSFQSGCGGIFFGLPTQGTANGMFPRMLAWAESVSEGMALSVNLAHGQAWENELFTSYRSRVYDEDGIQVNAWMAGRHRTLLPDFVTGTVDQALMAAFKKKFIMLLHLGLSGKAIIIDEVHAYDSYMSVFMETLLSWLGVYRLPVVLLSATLTMEKRNAFLSAYAGKTIKISSDAYPLISWAGADGTTYAREVKLDDSARKTKATLHGIKEDELPERLEMMLQNGGCAGVVLDTVKAAQEISKRLKETLSEEYRIILLHSRFLPEDRGKLENLVSKLVGAKSVERDKIIVVGTQVLEQSLDIDFDILFTDWCPIDLLFQRMGRLHRHTRKRPKGLEEAVCYIFDNEEARKRVNRVYCGPTKEYKEEIGSYIIRRTRAVLEGVSELVIPDDIRALTESVYDLQQGTQAQDKDIYIAGLRGLKNQAEQFCIPPANDSEFRGMLDNASDGEGGVRYGIHNMEVYLLKDMGTHLETFSGIRFSKSQFPSNIKIKEILRQRLSLRYEKALLEGIQEKKEHSDTKWLQDAMFRYYNIIIMSQDGTVDFWKKKYHYSQQYGWRRENE